MYHTISEFLEEWTFEGEATQKVLDALTDASLQQAVTGQDRNLGRIAWHIVVSIHEMLSRTGLDFAAAHDEAALPLSAKHIADSYREAATAAAAAIQQQWSDASLTEMRDMYGRQWSNSATLLILLKHQIHHRAQMTVLMRQAGLKVPGVYGPAREEWVRMGLEAPIL